MVICAESVPLPVLNALFIILQLLQIKLSLITIFDSNWIGVDFDYRRKIAACGEQNRAPPENTNLHSPLLRFLSSIVWLGWTVRRTPPKFRHPLAELVKTHIGVARQSRSRQFPSAQPRTTQSVMAPAAADTNKSLKSESTCCRHGY